MIQGILFFTLLFLLLTSPGYVFAFIYLNFKKLNPDWPTWGAVLAAVLGALLLTPLLAFALLWAMGKLLPRGWV